MGKRQYDGHTLDVSVCMAACVVTRVWLRLLAGDTAYKVLNALRIPYGIYIDSLGFSADSELFCGFGIVGTIFA